VDSKHKSRVRRARTVALLVAIGAPLSLAGPAHASFPGQNGKFVFEAPGVGGSDDIYTVEPDGTGLKNVTNSPSMDFLPAWSPDGKRIAFASDRDRPDSTCPENCRFEVYVMNADGGGVTRLTNNPSAIEALIAAWSPDGSKIAFEKYVFDPFYISAEGIYVMNADGSDPAQISSSFLPDSFLRWSPDGGKIAFSEERGAEEDNPREFIYSINPDGSDATLLASDASNPNWSPDGSRIVFDTYLTPGDTLRYMNRDGSGQTPLQPVTYGVQPVWSPDGTKIAFESGGGVSVMNADGSGPTQVVQGIGVDDWQPLPGPQRADFKNAAQFCKAERTFLGDSAFAQKYGTNDNGANAFGKCVSGSGG
jgi:TolB protein